MSKYKHLNLNERVKIQNMLENGNSFKAIGRELNRDCSTISKEVRNHIMFVKKGVRGKPFNDCANRSTCNRLVRGIYCHGCKKETPCTRCTTCFMKCSEYFKVTCDKLNTYPYVCNGCKTRHLCTLEKRYYNAIEAHKEYFEVLKESRSGVLITEEELSELNEIISPSLAKGQSLYHIIESNNDKIMWCDKTIRNYLKYGLLTSRNIDLPRQVKFKQRKCSKHEKLKIDRSCRIGRNYDDYNIYINNNDVVEITQMDTVEGRKGGKVLLTILFTSCNLILAYIRDRNDSQSVIDIYDNLYDILGHNDFCKLFGLILTDNGSEFSNPSKIEFSDNNIRRSRIYYCDPSAPYQKGKIENTHTLLRPIIPKGMSLDDLNQSDINKVINNVNSIKRSMLNGKSPYEAFVYKFGEKTAKKLGLDLILAKDIILNPKLIK